ncbi:MAG: iron-sulfur cluster carrier protein ApbC [Gammaproteobacteria bacterium CG_4_10_14_0_8_um_filter_38_16]|nr:MAG: iron-sulfur cluster carrier protein ApbC [Gammaproteobacteria bacterium CG_4_10_14_0_8_um_filter_38_16]PJA03671.1 MAG: iron-sulfur cluster carrier protein ApbC [Gammaproteobacteria bacterium CG_4_10_14_0_2_um_filter_38_22]PJB11337.1 MAG: iron-sulfur cluster carrier protein ApbC [Gammaproteobacteria bacterium CG_4_9_14_3_um_filter_38_9]
MRSTPFSIPGIKNIIAIASGKGGVGKSTTTVNLALALSAQHKRVGILDADIYGPNQPHMLGADEKPALHDNETFKPVIRHGLQTMSMGYLVDSEEPMVWRGPMVVKALQQMLYHTAWDNLDYLLIDLPPGTGDVQLTLSQKTPLNGAIIVTTPQAVALLDARKGLAMFRKVSVPILGVIENMSGYHCAQCGHNAAIFGEGGAEKLATEYTVPLLGKIPLTLKIREQADAGNPIFIAEPECDAAKIYAVIASQIVSMNGGERK